MSRQARSPALLLLLLAGCATHPAGEEPEAPNILLVFTDDAGWADFGFQGSRDHETPHIDGIAARGIRFTQGYVTASVCSPSRAGLLTGRYQQRYGHEYNLPGKPDPEVSAQMRGLPLTERTMADHLKAAGYRTGLIGKWHLGLEDRFHPLERGFDEFFGLRGGASPYFAGKATKVEDGRDPVPAESLPYLTDAFADRAVDFVRRQDGRPFFLFLSLTAPHGPLHARADHLEAVRSRFDTAARAKNVAMTRSIDEAVGRLVATLRDEGLLENTLLVFTNDNGGAMPYNASLNDPLRGTKGTCLEGGNRVPFVLSWPARLGGGVVEDRPVSTLDLLPTFVAAAGGALPDDLDGVDLLPYLDGERSDRPHETLYWKLNWGAAIRHGDLKLVRTPAGEEWLFDLAVDPGEREDLSDRFPERVEDLRDRLAAWEAELPEPVWVSAPRWRAHSLERYDQRKVEGWKRN